MCHCESEDACHRYVVPFEAAPAQLSELRRAVRSQLGSWGASAVTEEAELVATELGANVIKHVGRDVAASLVLELREGRVRLEVHDRSRALPTAPLGETCADSAESGRGLHLIAAMAHDWGAARTSTGKVIWCELSLKPAGCEARVGRVAAVLSVYGQCSGTSSLDLAALDETVTDVITDLLHWLAAQGGDPDGALGRAQMHYEAEAA
ncbi:ATP-binding protein [Streptomyces sp. CA-278952]|uniref:ATP-binding protein n=1 Tax=Streptomyces sp. CA-278952 TaxID=2980556 RepID=UPI002368E66E|nr:ATP-binding protein [Streptomyces sp. CA-278952]WDG31057.1 ATP-binding protein [Streptomyces sp. CA-278952]